MGENLGKSFSEKYDEDYEVVILGDGTQDYDFSILEKKVREFSRVGKDICMLYELSEKHAKILLKLCLDNSVNFYTHTGMKVDFPKVEIDDKRIFEMDVPVILVVGITEQTKKLDCVLNVKSHFEKCGYKVSAIGSKNFLIYLVFMHFQSLCMVICEKIRRFYILMQFVKILNILKSQIYL